MKTFSHTLSQINSPSGLSVELVVYMNTHLLFNHKILPPTCSACSVCVWSCNSRNTILYCTWWFASSKSSLRSSIAPRFLLTLASARGQVALPPTDKWQPLCSLLLLESLLAFFFTHLLSLTSLFLLQPSLSLSFSLSYRIVLSFFLSVSAWLEVRMSAKKGAAWTQRDSLL